MEGTSFGAGAAATVVDTAGDPVSGVPVLFDLGSVGSFDIGGQSTRTAYTNSKGVASAGTYTAAWGDRTGQLTASVQPGGTVTASQPLTVAGQTSQPILEAYDTSVTEGGPGQTTKACFRVVPNLAAHKKITFAATTVPDTAIAPSDYVAISSKVVTIAATASQAKVCVTVNGDAQVEPDETFDLVLSSPTNAVLGRATAVGTIVNDD